MSFAPSEAARSISLSVTSGPSCLKAPNRRERGRTGNIRTSLVVKYDISNTVPGHDPERFPNSLGQCRLPLRCDRGFNHQTRVWTH